MQARHGVLSKFTAFTLIETCKDFTASESRLLCYNEYERCTTFRLFKKRCVASVGVIAYVCCDKTV